MSDRLGGKVAIITGGASGLGKAIAVRMARDGARVAITDCNVATGAVVAAEHGLEFIEQDVTDEAGWPMVTAAVEAQLGPIDIVVNNAGIVGPLDDATPEQACLADWSHIFRVNVEGVFLGCRAAIAAMRRSGGGSIVNIASVAALRATPHALAYGASKAAVTQLSRSVAQYCAEQRLNIRCNSVHPGDVRTPMWDTIMQTLSKRGGTAPATMIARSTAAVPLGELAAPEDVAAMVAFLASDEARQITGAQFVVDGGIVGCDSFVAHPTPPASAP